MPHWYYLDGEQTTGPVSQDRLCVMVQVGQIGANHLVWNETLADWVTVESILELACHLPIEDKESSGETWRKGMHLICPHYCKLPPICFKCGQPAQAEIKHDLSWHSPIWYWTLLLGLLPYAVVAWFAKQPADLAIPLCQRHYDACKTARREAKGMAALSLLMIMSAPVWLVLARRPYEWICGLLLLSGAILLIVALVRYLSRGRVARSVYADDTYIHVAGACEALLKKF